MNEDRIYLDHAATSWPKPTATEAMRSFSMECGAAAGRGAYRSAQKATGIVENMRATIAKNINADSANCISFHANGTAALNAAILGLLDPGDHVVTTAADHNSVLRPLHHLEASGKISLTVVPCDAGGMVLTSDIGEAIRPETSLVAVTHASNVTGAVEPLDEIGELLSAHPAMLLCDAAQTFGYTPIDVKSMNVDLLAAPGHKGSLGPLGSAFLYANEPAAQKIRPTIFGGTGSRSESLEMPDSYPAKLEAGNVNVPALAGWLAAMEQINWTDGWQEGDEFSSRLHSELSQLPGVQIFGAPSVLPVVSLSIKGLSPIDVAAILDSEFNIETRAGLHCAGLIHKFLGSEGEGTLRISAGHSTTHQEIDHVCDAISAIASEANV